MMIRRMLMSGFGLGYAPVASGTFGSTGACAIALAAWAVTTGMDQPASTLDAIWAVLALLASIGCVIWGPWAASYYTGRCRKEGDPGQVVLDEWAGQWVALLFFPMPTLTWAVGVIAMQFFFFRLFDVLKLPPGRQFEKLPGGWGILLDDLAAGVYANIVGQVILRLLV